MRESSRAILGVNGSGLMWGNNENRNCCAEKLSAYGVGISRRIATLAAGLHSHRPELLDGVGVIVGIDRFMSEARALTNFCGNAVATLLVGRWTSSIDRDRVHQVLDGKLPYRDTEDDSHVNMARPDVTNPATATLQPTPQVDLDHYRH